jgi:hypothetical protein
MTLLRQLSTSISALILTAIWTSPALAANCERADPSLAGHYSMWGVMEVGSELRLQANGSFDYMLAYGALDEFASGCWHRVGNVLTLVPSKFETNGEDPLKFDRLELEVTPAGKLVRRFDGGPTGTYSR